mmetsp:Transcript_38934/g.70887  ORF Transcript_38934/g.70887 Transcript_38934/m.70887 type:complete len:158 (-) Transcript_38934:89-562(-)
MSRRFAALAGLWKVISFLGVLVASIGFHVAQAEEVKDAGACSSSLLQLASNVVSKDAALTAMKDTPDSDVQAMISRDEMMSPDWVTPFKDLEEEDIVEEAKVNELLEKDPDSQAYRKLHEARKQAAAVALADDGLPAALEQQDTESESDAEPPCDHC